MGRRGGFKYCVYRSADSVNAQKNFQTKQSLPYDLISDTKFELIGPLGAKKTAKGGVTRSHWIIKDGKIAVKALGISPVDSFTKALEYVKAEIEGGDKNNKEEKDEPKEESKEESKDESKEESKEKATEEPKEESKEEPKEDSKDKSKDEAKDEPKDESEESK